VIKGLAAVVAGLALASAATVTTIRGNVPWLLLGRAASW
jgi:hypothetical protein